MNSASRCSAGFLGHPSYLHTVACVNGEEQIFEDLQGISSGLGVVVLAETLVVEQVQNDFAKVASHAALLQAFAQDVVVIGFLLLVVQIQCHQRLSALREAVFAGGLQAPEQNAAKRFLVEFTHAAPVSTSRVAAKLCDIVS